MERTIDIKITVNESNHVDIKSIMKDFNDYPVDHFHKLIIVCFSRIISDFTTMVEKHESNDLKVGDLYELK